ncbi:cytochrome P450 [Amniculicola lignicola CBS 123094]|uniref:Cytochrome P450 n=1 Tax=Amniculicola lignicola CBS 123094 TaxID=1392246 RepID=A0A6A5W698_9PLEO|nr:cytochrome P450 [Amniculicola lignicola CBS 123094]
MKVLTFNESARVAVALCSASVVTAITTALTTKTLSGYSFLIHVLTWPIRYITQRISAWIFLFNGPQMIQSAFDKAGGKPFELFAPDIRCVFISSSDQIKELDSAPDTVLSLQAASKQMLQPKYSMHGFNWFDRRGTEGVGFIRALRTLLTNHLPAIMPDLRIVLTTKLRSLVSAHRQKFSSGKEASELAIYPMIVQLVVLANSLSFFGSDLAKNEKFMTAALSYVEETILVAEIIRLLPRFLHPLAGKLLRGFATSQAAIYDALMVTAEERVRERDLGHRGKKYNDCIQWIMETSPKANPWSAQRVVFELIAIWFGSVHAMSTTITFCIEDLCLHPEYAAPLRHELQSLQYADFETKARGLPLLDSFIKESARLTPVESLSTRRQALQPFTLADGTHLNVGDWACTPVRALMQDPRHYPSALSFHGFRFVEPSYLDSLPSEYPPSSTQQVLQPEPSKLTDVGGSFHVWGTGRMACPGRFYAAAIMKIIVAQVVLDYEVELVDPEKGRWWQWRSTVLPRESTMVRFTERERC